VVRYYISYEIGFVTDETIIQHIHDYSITLPSTTNNNGVFQYHGLKYEGGKLHMVHV